MHPCPLNQSSSFAGAGGNNKAIVPESKATAGCSGSCCGCLHIGMPCLYGLSCSLLYSVCLHSMTENHDKRTFYLSCASSRRGPTPSFQTVPPRIGVGMLGRHSAASRNAFCASDGAFRFCLGNRADAAEEPPATTGADLRGNSVRSRILQIPCSVGPRPPVRSHGPCSRS